MKVLVKLSNGVELLVILVGIDRSQPLALRLSFFPFSLVFSLPSFILASPQSPPVSSVELSFCPEVA